jgi:hypothetical protein
LDFIQNFVPGYLDSLFFESTSHLNNTNLHTAIMSKNRTGLYLGLAAAGAGGYYLYRAGGDVKGAKQEMKSAYYFFPGNDVAIYCLSVSI